MAYFSEKDMAEGIVKMFRAAGLAVSSHPPVRLGIYDTFLFDQT